MRSKAFKFALLAAAALPLAAQPMPPQGSTMPPGATMPGGPMPGQPGQADPPSRVARLNYETGPVSFRPGSVEDWTAATLNYPLTTGDHLWTDVDARTEMHVGSTAIRMAPQTALAILNLDDRTTQLSLTQGVLHVRVRQLSDAEAFEVDTPNSAITLLRPGEYHIEADGNNNVTIVSVVGGDAQVTGSGTAVAVHPSQSARIMGTEQVSQDMGPALPPSEFDGWCEQRDHAEDQAIQSARYVPRDMIGYEDLDRSGVWRNVPPYGWVWQPTAVGPGWAPYRYGHWAWVEPWGWTWIDDAPWGFAPFHYGRWAMVGPAWVWVPGTMVVGVRPVYAPALVAFVGGPRFGVAVGVGGGAAMAAWFPLGPGEVFRPAYAVSPIYVRQVNIMTVRDVTVVNARYVNQGFGVTVVSHETFVGARPVGGAIVAVDRSVIVGAPVIVHPGIVPERVSVLARVGPAPAVPPARFVERTVVVRATPPPPRVAFAAEQRALVANGGRPLAPAEAERFRAAAPARAPMYRPAGAPAALHPAERPSGFAGAPGGPVRNDRPGFANSPNRPSPEAAQPRNERPVPAAEERRPNNQHENRNERKPKKEERKEREERERDR